MVVVYADHHGKEVTPHYPMLNMSMFSRYTSEILSPATACLSKVQPGISIIALNLLMLSTSKLRAGDPYSTKHCEPAHSLPYSPISPEIKSTQRALILSSYHQVLLLFNFAGSLVTETST